MHDQAPVMEKTWLDDDGETTLMECNDCGVLVPAYNELCQSCFTDEELRERGDY